MFLADFATLFLTDETLSRITDLVTVAIVRVTFLLASLISVVPFIANRSGAPSHKFPSRVGERRTAAVKAH